jgi:hypothetical protein
MKAVGFLHKHDPHISCSKELTNILSIHCNEDRNLKLVASYLKKGIPVIKYISELYDKDEELIGPNIVYTDGDWVWPGYYIFYLNKYKNLMIPEAFLKHISNKGDAKDISVTSAEKNYVEYMLAKLMNAKMLPDNNLPFDVQLLLNSKGDSIECY